MSLHNSSVAVTHFFFRDLEIFQTPVVTAVIIMIIYVVLTLANAMNIVFIICDQKLHKPMYILSGNLAVVDIVLTSSVNPTIIGVLFGSVKSISYESCLTQMFVYHLASMMEMFILAFMALDRLLAINCPFQYHNHLTARRTVLSASILWFCVTCIMVVTIAALVPRSHCYLTLTYIYCDYASVLRSTCADINYYFNIISVMSFIPLVCTFVFICLSYTVILVQVKLSSSSEKRKIGSTCFSHLITVTCYYSPMFFRVVLTRAGLVLSLEQWHYMMFTINLGPSLVNPFVYCLSTKDIRCKLLKVVQYFDKSH